MSHFIVFANTPCPEGVSTISAIEPGRQALIDKSKAALIENPRSFAESYFLRKLEYIPSPFETAVASEIETMMEPFAESTEDPDYLKFINVEEEEREKFESGVVDCVRMPNGTICTIYDSQFDKRFTCKDGLVYQRNFGSLHHDKRTAKAKKILVLDDYPIKKLHPSFTEYMEEHCNYSFDEETQAYGYHCNPNAQWDWYQIGGRWPFMFLVPENDQCVLLGERSWANSDAPSRPAPEGYKWVTGARKSAICWSKMKLIELKNAVKQFLLLKNWFNNGVQPEEEMYAKLTDEGVVSWGDMLYRKGELLGEHLHRIGLGSKQRIACSSYAYLHDGAWHSKGDMGWWAISTNDKEESTWADEVAHYIDSIPDDDMLISIDCHI